MNHYHYADERVLVQTSPTFMFLLFSPSPCKELSMKAHDVPSSVKS